MYPRFFVSCLVAFFATLPVGCTGSSDNEGFAPVEGNYVPDQRDGNLFAINQENGEEINCGPVNEAVQFDSKLGCVAFEKDVYPYSYVTTAKLALIEMTSEDDLAKDCGGVVKLPDGTVMKSNCGPLSTEWCGGPGEITLNDKPYLNLWICAEKEVEGTCLMRARPNPCPSGKECHEVGDYPDYAQCITPPFCTTDAECDDKNQCTVNDCQDNSCVSVLSDASCDDGDPCTLTDKCQNQNGEAVCVGVENTCDDGNQCTVDGCLANGTCSHVLEVGLDCDDSDACTEGDLCLNDGTCKGNPKNCNDGDLCTSDSCAGNQCVNASLPVGTSCDDGNPCTESDKCSTKDDKLVCGGTSKDCEDGDLCTKDTCTEATGACAHTDEPDETDCSEAGDESELCVGGDCVPEQLTCEVDGVKYCLEVGGKLGQYECEMADTLGKGVLLVDCGTVGAGVSCDADGTPPCSAPSEQACADGEDNDDDGVSDCDDADCDDAAACQPPVPPPPPVCTPSCTGKACGDDSCGGSCGTCSGATPQCNASSTCVECLNSTHCAAGESCTGDVCVAGCTPACTGKECGSDGCGGSCGTCGSKETCSDGSCFSALGALCPKDVAMVFYDTSVPGKIQQSVTSDGKAKFGFDTGAPEGKTGSIVFSKDAGCTACYNAAKSTPEDLPGGGFGCYVGAP